MIVWTIQQRHKLLAKILLAVLILCAAIPVNAAVSATMAPGEVERFDVHKGEVTARAPCTPELRKEAELLIRSFQDKTDILRIDPENGTVLKIPLEPLLEIRRPGFYAFAAEMFLFLPEGKDPYMLVFTEENQPRLFAMTRPVDRLLQLCGWEDVR
ncbi:MAG: hypothetical protein K0R57_6610 [Paenibacillaceae bacterium]|jgi:hypothetical protein|nr:hypothetical protein [Paenibacillaceae bacterium]